MKFEHTQVMNFEAAFRGMRNPKNSWKLSDSNFHDDCHNPGDHNCESCKYFDGMGKPCLPYIGPKDLALAQSLIRAGSEHRKFMRQIFVSVDITAPDYWFKEFSTYRVGTVENSTSTMHKVMSRPFTYDMFELKGMRGYRKIVEQSSNEIDLDNEIWAPWPSNPTYVVSSEGRVKRNTYVSTHGQRYKERMLNGSLHEDEYIFISVLIDGQRRQIPKHRMVAETFIENPLDKPEVNHKDGNKQNNRVGNLEWVTRQENMIHSVQTGLSPVNVHTYTGKFTKEQREQIIEEYSLCNISKRELAKKYNVSHSTICSITNGKYQYGADVRDEYAEFQRTLDELNALRDEYLETRDKQVWKMLIQKLPMSYLYTRTVTMSYENILAMCSKGQRRFHKLTEWSQDFISWARSLPYAQELIFLDEIDDARNELDQQAVKEKFFNEIKSACENCTDDKARMFEEFERIISNYDFKEAS